MAISLHITSRSQLNLNKLIFDCRTLEFLMRHLSRLAAFSYITNMHSKNLAIVWAPNLLR